MPCRLVFIPVLIFSLGILFLLLATGVFAAGVDESSAGIITPTPTFDISRLEQPPTPAFPDQAEIGRQVFWGMCMSCHGDQSQGLTAELRDSFGKENRDCWTFGCHDEDAPQNSFLIPTTGAPALTGVGFIGAFSQYI